MAESPAQARVHLYPGHDDDVTAFTLMESQAAGLPAVVRPLGAAPERIVDGLSGWVAPDDDAFANLAIRLLSDDALRASRGAEARALWTGRDWDAAAAALEAPWHDPAAAGDGRRRSTAAPRRSSSGWPWRWSEPGCRSAW